MTDNSYINWAAMSDNALARQIGEFVRHHRTEHNKTQGELASEAGISRSTLSLLERGDSVTLATLIRVLRVLDLLYIMNVFRIEERISPLALSKLQKNKRIRVRGNSKHGKK